MKKKKIKNISRKQRLLRLKPLFDDTEFFENVEYKDIELTELSKEEKDEIDKLIEEIIT